MPIYIITGRLGSGKSLATVGRIRDLLAEGRPVATNLDLNLEKLCGPRAKTPRVVRLPDKPTVAHLDSLGRGNESYDETKNGGIFLDEVSQLLGDLRNLPRRARGAKPETEEDKDARAASVKSAAKRAKQNVRLRCKTARVTHMITLTTRECITDLERFLKLWDAFRRVMSRHREFHYIAVPEPQKRGAWHMHVAVSGRAALNLARRAWLKVVGGRGKGYCHIRNPQGAHFGKQWKLDALASYIAKYIGKDIAETRFNKKKYYTSRGINVPEAVVYAIENNRADCVDAIKDVLTTLCSEFDIADIRCFVALDGSSYFASACKPVPLQQA